MANVFDAADFILNNRETTTAWQLQKLCYYSKAWGVAINDNPIFPEPFEAWKNGPVCRELYYRHKGRKKIDKTMFSSLITNSLKDEDRAIIRAVMYRYGSLSGEELRTQTHSEKPWIEARGGIPEDQDSSNPIDEKVMKSFYSGLKGEWENIDNNMLFYLSEYRDHNNSTTITLKEAMNELGIKEEDIAEAEDVEYEIEPLILR